MFNVTAKRWTYRGLFLFISTAVGGNIVNAQPRPETSTQQPADEAAAWLAPFPGQLSAELLASFNAQTGHELEAAYTYLDLANHFNEHSLEGFGSWFTAQFYEEVNHSRMFMNFIKSKRQQAVLGTLQHLNINKTTPLEILKQSLKAEEDQTQRIRKLYDQSVAAGDHTATSFLKFFLDEQVQEEDMFANVVDRLALVEGNQAGLLLIDKELAARRLPAIFVPRAQ